MTESKVKLFVKLVILILFSIPSRNYISDDGCQTSSVESVELLLKNHADPNLLSQKNEEQNALASALKTGNEKIISLLSSVTTQGMESCIKILAESNMAVGKEVEEILQKLVKWSHGKVYA